MARLFIVVGDSISSGGSVLSGSPSTDIEGRPMARAGDRIICKAHGPGTIISGDITFLIDGQPAARQGDRTSCGCSLIAGQQSLVFIDNAPSVGASASAPQRDASRGPVMGGQPSPGAAPTPSAFTSRARAAPVCWANDHDIRVAANAYGRYYQIYGPDGDAMEFSMERRFRISIPLHSMGDVEVVVKLKVVAAATTPEAPLTEEDINAVKARMEAGIRQFWNSKFRLSVSDPLCGERVFPIRYKVEWVSRGQDYTMNVRASAVRENVHNLQLNVWKDTSVWTMAHEYAHCAGIADEYAYNPDETWTLRYYAHDRTLHEHLIELPSIKPHSDSTATIMSTADKATVEPRHAWPIALEAQDFLTSKIGRTITCTIT